MGKTRKVLLIEDEPDVADYLRVVLQSNGYSVAMCRSAREGMKIVDEFSPDLICLDIMMPFETGISFYVRLRQSTGHAHIPVIILSGVIHDGDFDFRSYVPDEAIPFPEHYFEKPIEVDKFLNTVACLMAENSARNV